MSLFVAGKVSVLWHNFINHETEVSNLWDHEKYPWKKSIFFYKWIITWLLSCIKEQREKWACGKRAQNTFLLHRKGRNITNIHENLYMLALNSCSQSKGWWNKMPPEFVGKSHAPLTTNNLILMKAWRGNAASSYPQHPRLLLLPKASTLRSDFYACWPQGTAGLEVTPECYPCVVPKDWNVLTGGQTRWLHPGGSAGLRPQSKPFPSAAGRAPASPGR